MDRRRCLLMLGAAALVLVVATGAAGDARDGNSESASEKTAKLIDKLSSRDVASRDAAQRALREMPAARPALRQATKSEDAEVALRARAALRYLNVTLRDPLFRRTITPEERGNEDRPFRPLFEKEIADGEVGRKIYNRLFKAERELFKLAWQATAPGVSAEEAAKRQSRFNEQSLQRWNRIGDKLGDDVQRRIRARDFPYLRPADLDTRTSIAALYFLRGAVREPVPDLLSAQKKRLFYAFNPFKGSKKGKAGSNRQKAWRQCVRFGLQAARGEQELNDGLRIATLYRDWQSARLLARRAARSEGYSHPVYFRAAHALVARGEGKLDMLAAYRLLDIKTRQKPAGWSGATVPQRSYLEVREVALQALMRMAGEDPKKDKGLGAITPTCPYARKVEMFYVKDPDRWNQIIKRWAKKLGAADPP